MSTSGVARRMAAGAVPAGVLVAIALILAFAVVPPLIGGYLVRALTSYLIFGLLALAVGLITGYGRLFNLGVGANFGVGAYAVAILSHQGVTNPFALLGAAVLAGLLVALLYAFFALAATGVEYLMLTFLTTLAFASVPLTMIDLTGGDNGLSVVGGTRVSFGLNPLEGNGFYWFVLAIVAGCTLLSWFIVSSQTGKAIQAIGRNAVRASAMGYSVGSYRVALTLYSGVMASLGGWLFALQAGFVYTDLLGLANSTNGLVYALIGGVDTILGPLLGTAVLRSLTEQLSRGSTQSSLYIGVVLLLVVYFIPEGILGLWRRRSWGRLAAGRRAKAPVEQPDTAAAGLTAENVEAL
jgi:branched-chain amino acid transport system permease protein